MNFANKTITDEIAIAQYQKIWDKLTVEQMATELEFDSIDIGRDSSVLIDIINGMEAIKDKIEDDKNQRGIYNNISQHFRKSVIFSSWTYKRTRT